MSSRKSSFRLLIGGVCLLCSFLAIGQEPEGVYSTLGVSRSSTRIVTNVTAFATKDMVTTLSNAVATSVGPTLVTNVAPGIVSNVVTKSYVESLDISASMVEIDRLSLNTLKTTSQLVPGTAYRITNYVAQSKAPSSQTNYFYVSANHPFDIVMTAISTNMFASQSAAMLHTGDAYFANNDLSAWKIWYDLDSNVVTRMIDEFNNDIPWDFKGIKFARFPVRGLFSYSSQHSDPRLLNVLTNSLPVEWFNPDDPEYGGPAYIIPERHRAADYSGRYIFHAGQIWETCKDPLDCRYYYTLSNYAGTDSSLSGNIANVKIGSGSRNIVVLDSFGESLTMGPDCQDITINASREVVLGSNCSSLLLGYISGKLVLGNYCYNTLFRYNDRDVSPDNCFDTIVLDEHTYNNTVVLVPDRTHVIHVGAGSWENNILPTSTPPIADTSTIQLGSGNDHNSIFGENISLGNICYHNFIGEGCNRITLANNVNTVCLETNSQDIVAGESSSAIFIGPRSQNCTFGPRCSWINFGPTIYNPNTPDVHVPAGAFVVRTTARPPYAGPTYYYNDNEPVGFTATHSLPIRWSPPSDVAIALGDYVVWPESVNSGTQFWRCTKAGVRSSSAPVAERGTFVPENSPITHVWTDTLAFTCPAYRNIHVKAGTHDFSLYCPDTEGTTNVYANVTIGMNASGTPYSPNTITDHNVNQSFETYYGAPAVASDTLYIKGDDQQYYRISVSNEQIRAVPSNP